MDGYIEHFVSVYNFKPLLDNNSTSYCLDYNCTKIFFDITGGQVKYLSDNVFDEMFVHRKATYFLINQHKKGYYYVDAIYFRSSVNLSVRVIWAIKRIFEKYTNIWLNFTEIEVKIDNKNVKFVKINFNESRK